MIKAKADAEEETREAEEIVTEAEDEEEDNLSKNIFYKRTPEISVVRLLFVD